MDVELIFFTITLAMAGAAMGTFTGLVPGIHVNTLAALMLSSYPAIGDALASFFPPHYVPILVSSCIVSAAVVHSFVDFVPSVFLGAPDPDEVMNILPGHRLLLEGRGMVAVRAAALGSVIGTTVSIAAAVPMQFLMTAGLGDYLENITLVVLSLSLVILIMNERGPGMVWAVVLMILSGMIGAVCMTLPDPAGIVPGGSFLFPLLTGLFGVPAMIVSMNNDDIPEQVDDEGDPVGPMPGIKGAVIGAFVGWFPGITATTGAVIGGMAFRESGAERFISLVASIGSASAVFALVTLSVTGSGRSGTMVVIGDVLGGSLSGAGSEVFMLMLLSVAAASLIGYVVTIRSGLFLWNIVKGRNMAALNKAILVMMTILVALMTGWIGMLILAASSIVGLIPTSVNVSRVHLSGCLVIPAILLATEITNIF